MKVKFTYISYFDLNPEDFREIDDEGKIGPIPSNEKLFKILKDSGYLGECLSESLNTHFYVEFNEV